MEQLPYYTLVASEFDLYVPVTVTKVRIAEALL